MRVGRPVGIVMLLATCTACHAWRVEPLPLPRGMVWDEPVRVTTSNALVLQLTEARIERDTLRGLLKTAGMDSLIVLPMSRVWRIERYESDDDATLKLVMLPLMVTVLTGVTLFFIGLSKPW